MTGVAFDLAGRRVYVAGHRGMVGSAVMRRLAQERCEVVTAGRGDVDLRRQLAVERFMAEAKPDAVVLAAARVGGIAANSSRPAEFLYDNLMLQANVIHAAAECRVAKLLFLGSSCVYPRMAPQPISEDALLSGPLEPTNRWYAIAKVSGLMLCQSYREQHGLDFISAMPTNLYGPGDNFDEETGHVIPALMRRFDAARSSGAAVTRVWGSGRPLREFLHVDDCADALVFLLRRYSAAETINVGSGEEVSIADLAQRIADVVGFRGQIVFDPSRPDGTPRKLLDVGRLTALGWRPRIDLSAGLAQTYDWYRRALADEAAVRGVSPTAGAHR